MGRKGVLLRALGAAVVGVSVIPAAAAGASSFDLAAARGLSSAPSVSASGRYVAFTSSASDLVAGDSNGAPDVFVRDRGTGRVERISVGNGGAQARRLLFGSGEPAISGDGRYVAFSSDAPNLVSGDRNFRLDVFVRDRVAETTRRVSISSAGVEAHGESSSPAISADGSTVAFVSRSAGLVSGDTNHTIDVFVSDLASSTTERVSVSSSEEQVRGAFVPFDGQRPALSADGAIVAFASPARDLVPGDSNFADDVFVRDRAAGTTSLVSVDADGAQRRFAGSRSPSLSADGELVAFDTTAGLDPSDANRSSDVYVRDRAGSSTVWASPGTDRAGSEDPVLSSDGRYVLFDSRSRLLADDTDRFSDVYRYERSTATTTLASIDTWYQRQGSGAVEHPSSSANGLVVAFSAADGLIPDDADGAPDVIEQVLDASRPSISFLGLVSLAPFDVNAPQPPISDVPFAGQVVYRVWGGGTRQFGASWTPVAPSGLGPDRYRYSTGLPDRLNAGSNVTVGKLDAASSVVLIRPALPLNPNDTFDIPEYADSGVTYRTYTGGVIEYIIPAAEVHVLDAQTQTADPPYGGVPPGCVPAPRGCAGDRAP